ncbi:MAG: hypothetical protein GC178_01415 [Flavobacteriales bacterium]|nr:hypothetical protein [Flavobacteriales bacterium]
MKQLGSIFICLCFAQLGFSEPQDTCKMLSEDHIKLWYNKSNNELKENPPFQILIRDTIVVGIRNSDISKLRMLESWARSEKCVSEIRTDVEIDNETTNYIHLESRLQEDRFELVMLFLNRVRKKCEQLGIDPCHALIGFKTNHRDL